MIVDGKALAQKLKEELIREVRKRSEKPRLVIISVGENPVSKR
jgi:5,10-methylene-tetrahydrofolate dehydrogenase/methenyl tetrahydrofolate cyclohydrolase